MKKNFDIDILENVIEFFDSIEKKAVEKILHNMRRSQVVLDNKFFKKLNNEIWEFRTLYNKKQYRILAFWDKTSKTDTLVVGTSGFIKKTQKTPKKELNKAEKIRSEYFQSKTTIKN
ncbi:type II toxin-antitoxin system RelE/ParE family toxin [Wenyingzhuangia sp. 1_MG-2023]|nr:type II toxin-antitoxin system RelE/ParE family toxin [Wenyingzhuangia sp. 1_MG-2023]